MSIKEQIEENNRKISELLAENETLYAQTTEVEQYIKFPAGWAPTVAKIKSTYHLDEIFLNEDTKSNWCYLFQYLQYERYIFNRFKTFGSVRTYLLKNAKITYASLIEAVIIETAEAIRRKCAGCPKCGGCDIHISRNDTKTMKNALSKLIAISAFTLPAETVNEIITLYNSRNTIHIPATDCNELTMKKHTSDECNEADQLLNTVIEHIYNHSIHFYNDLSCKDE